MTVRLIPYLVMNGNSQEAIDFYTQALDATLLFKSTFGEMPSNPDFPLPDFAKDMIGHASIRIGESDVMFSDAFPGQEHTSGTQVTICVSTNDAAQATRYFNALTEGGTIGLPIQETHFSPAYGIVTDKFGVQFQVFTEPSQQ